MPFIKKSLEQMLGSQRFERLKDSKKYKFAIEGTALTTFSYAVMVPIELGIAKMEFQEHLQTRIMGAAVGAIIGRPLGMWRNFVLKKLNITDESNAGLRYLADSFSFVSAQLPVYLTMTMIAGADIDETLRAAGTITALSGAMGGPYGTYLDKVRYEAGLPKEYCATQDDNEQKD
jgi:hypothetical protein